MTPAQIANLKDIYDTFEQEISAKYKKGVEEHGGNLWEHDELWLIEQAMAENIDQYTYLHTARNKMLERRYGVPKYCKLNHLHEHKCWIGE